MTVRIITAIISVLLGIILICSFMDKKPRVILIGNIVIVGIIMMITLWALALAHVI